MQGYRVRSVDTITTRAVRVDRTSPGYGHPAVLEVAGGTGPCRSCLRLFEVGREHRLLFTYQPRSGSETTGAPGPVVIHAEDCPRFDAPGFPPDLERLPLVIEGRTEDGRVLHSVRVPGDGAEEAAVELLGRSEIDFLFLRHGEAGCYIARIERT